MNFRIKILGVFIPLCLMLCFMSNTYSRYVADTTGNLKMTFAQWQILVNNDDITNSVSSSVVLNPIIDEKQHVESNKIAPSSTGHFDISIDPSNVDVSFNYSIALEVVNENLPDLMITKYAILNHDFKEDDTITYKNIENNIIEGSLEIEKTSIATNSDEIIATESDEIKEFSFEPFIIRICFEWYEGTNEKMNDEDDTLAIQNNKNNDLEINATIKFEQKLDATL